MARPEDTAAADTGVEPARVRSGAALARLHEAPEPEHPLELGRYTTEQLYGELLRRYDEDPTRDGLLKTPERVSKAMSFLTQGYREDPLEILRSALFDVDYDEMVIVKDIEMYSLCEHHMLPFFGRVHIAYIPN